MPGAVSIAAAWASGELPPFPDLPPLACPHCRGPVRWDARPEGASYAGPVRWGARPEGALCAGPRAPNYGRWSAPGVWTVGPTPGLRGTYACATTCPRPSCGAPLALRLRVRSSHPFGAPGAYLVDRGGIWHGVRAIGAAELVPLEAFLRQHRARDLLPSFVRGTEDVVRVAFFTTMPALAEALVLRSYAIPNTIPHSFWDWLGFAGFLCVALALPALAIVALVRHLRGRAGCRRSLRAQARGGNGSLALRCDGAAGAYRGGAFAAASPDPGENGRRMVDAVERGAEGAVCSGASRAPSST